MKTHLHLFDETLLFAVLAVLIHRRYSYINTSRSLENSGRWCSKLSMHCAIPPRIIMGGGDGDGDDKIVVSLLEQSSLVVRVFIFILMFRF